MLTGTELTMLAEVMKDPADAATLDAARKGDLGSLRDLHRLLDRRPELWKAFGDAARYAEDALLDLFAGEGLLTKESVRRRLAQMKVELADGDALVFLGDSITHGCLYTQYVEDFFYTRFPTRRLHFHNAGVSGDRCGDVVESRSTLPGTLITV